MCGGEWGEGGSGEGEAREREREREDQSVSDRSTWREERKWVCATSVNDVTKCETYRIGLPRNRYYENT